MPTCFFSLLETIAIFLSLHPQPILHISFLSLVVPAHASAKLTLNTYFQTFKCQFIVLERKRLLLSLLTQIHLCVNCFHPHLL